MGKRLSKTRKKDTAKVFVKDSTSTTGHNEEPFVLWKRRLNPTAGVFDWSIAGLQRLHRNSVVVVDRGTREPVLMVKFHPFSDISSKLKDEFQECFTNLRKAITWSSLVKGNGAHKRGGGQGNMYGLGWRSGYMKEKTFGLYTPAPKLTLGNWIDLRETRMEVGKFYHKRFQLVSPQLCETATKTAAKYHVPAIYADEFASANIESSTSFPSNLSITDKDFATPPHIDNDVTDYTFGIFGPTYSTSGKLASVEDGFGSIGGHFIIPTYGVYVDFCDGITEIIWRGPHDYHGTTNSTTAPGFTRIGTSLQIAKSLAQRAAKMALEPIEQQQTRVDSFSSILKRKFCDR